MTPLTVIRKLVIGGACEAYSSVDIVKSGLFNGEVINLPRKIYCIRESIQNTYDLNNVESTLDGTTNFLIALCGSYYLKANLAINEGGAIPSSSTFNPNSIAPFSYIFVVGVDSDAPTVGSYTFQLLRFQGALNLTKIFINDTTETLNKDFTFDSATGKITRPLAWNNGDVILIEYFKIV